MMQGMIKILIGQSFFAGAVLYLCPEGSVRRVLKLLCTAILTATVLSPIRTLDYNMLSLEEARFTLAEAEICSRAEKASDSLKKMVLQDNCKEYIESRGLELGLDIQSTRIELKQNEGGQWLPYSAKIEAAGADTAAEELARLLSRELGIATERQVWTLYG